MTQSKTAKTGQPKRRGKPLATGKYDTREKLVEMVLMHYYGGNDNLALIGRNTGVSAVTVSNIVESNKVSVNCMYDDGVDVDYTAPAYLQDGEIDLERIKDYLNDKAYRGRSKIVELKLLQ